MNGEDTQAMNTAIACVVESRDPDLSSHLIGYLLGEADGIPKICFGFPYLLHFCCVAFCILILLLTCRKLGLITKSTILLLTTYFRKWLILVLYFRFVTFVNLSFILQL